jgi:hypothetical protein
MAESKGTLGEIEKLIRKNVILHFASQPSSEKTLEKVEAFAQKQLDFFIDGMMKQSPEVFRAWRGKNPFTAKAAINRETMDFQIQLVEKESGKW